MQSSLADCLSWINCLWRLGNPRKTACSGKSSPLLIFYLCNQWSQTLLNSTWSLDQGSQGIKSSQLEWYCTQNHFLCKARAWSRVFARALSGRSFRKLRFPGLHRCKTCFCVVWRASFAVQKKLRAGKKSRNLHQYTYEILTAKLFQRCQLCWWAELPTLHS